MQLDAEESAAAEARLLEASHGASSPQDVIALVTRELYEGQIAVVSSFGAESAVLLHMISEIDPATQTVEVHRPGRDVETLAKATTLSGEDVMSGLVVDLAEILYDVD